MSLIEELGLDYCNEMLVGAMFMYEGRPHMLRAVVDDELRVCSVAANGELGEQVTIPHEFFSSWSVLKYPTLGYREYMNGAFLGYLTRRPSTRRGLQWNDIRCTVHDSTTSLHHILQRAASPVLRKWLKDWGMTPGEVAQHGSRRGWQAFNTEFTPFASGLAQVMDGTRPSFAMSPEFAVAPRADGEGLEILYRQRRIGTIQDTGKIAMNINSKVINELWEQETSRG